MKRILNGVFAVALFGGLQVNAQQYFKPFDGKQAPSAGKQVLVPDHFIIETLSQSGIQPFLNQLSALPQNASTIALPQPDGTTRDFSIWRSSMMDPSLQSKYNQIQTFTAVAKDNKMVTAKLDYTPAGFHAMIFDGDHSYFIDPYSDVNDGYYSVYYRSDYHRSLDHLMQCGLDNTKKIQDAAGNNPDQLGDGLTPIGEKQYGSVTRTYRLALSCTGEYAIAVGGATPTKASVLAAMVTSMNRVNGIYERELGITMNFIANEDTLIYLDPNTDPFTANNQGSTLLTQNSSNTGTIIGSANYDIGHIFSTGGGGIAGLGVVCRNNGNGKARGVTGSLNPVGDAYDVDYVAHEMGHQYGADHTFNRCSNTENEETAFEPGSGSTIMAYAGICGVINNLQLHSDAYFHAVSLDEITDYVSTQGNCSTNGTGNVVLNMDAIQANYKIPYQTPFELTAPLVNAVNSDTISYCWEQWNLGNFQTDEVYCDTILYGPSLRSFTPSLSPVRVFPRIDSLVNNVTSYIGERLPKAARGLTFKLTSRNIYQGFGTFNFSDDSVTIAVINTGAPFKVTEPNISSDTAYTLGSKTITWNVAQTSIAPINTTAVNIYLSVDGGYTYPYTLATNVPNSGSASVMMPDTITNKARVKVKGAGNVFFDISDANFRILKNPTLSIADIQLGNDLNVFPNPATTQIQLSYKNGNELSVILYNAIGQKMYSGKLKQNLDIPVSGYARGMYYLQVNDVEKGIKATKRITLE